MKYDLTLIVFTYNHEKYIEECLYSIIRQETEYSYQVLIFDDNSNDGSVDLIKKVINGHDNFKLYSSDINYGCPEICSTSLIDQQINSNFIAYLDGDDYWFVKDKIQKQIYFLKANKNFIGVSSNFACKNETKKTFIEENKVIVQVTLLDWLLESNTYSHVSTFIWRNNFKELFPPIMKRFDLHGDYVIAACFLRHGKIKVLEEVMSVYRIHDKGMWTSMNADKKHAYNKNLFSMCFPLIPFRMYLKMISILGSRLLVLLKSFIAAKLF